MQRIRLFTVSGKTSRTCSYVQIWQELLFLNYFGENPGLGVKAKMAGYAPADSQPMGHISTDSSWHSHAFVLHVPLILLTVSWT